MKYKYNAFRILFFCLLFLLMDYRYISKGKNYNDYYILSNSIMSINIGYNNLSLIVGIVITTLFVLGLRTVLVESPVSLVRYGKKRFVNKNLSNILLDSFLISIEYVGITIIFCLISFDVRILLESGFFLCVFLYCLMLCMYFYVVGATTFLIKVAFYSKKIYIFISLFIFFALAATPHISHNISPVYFCGFIEEWFNTGYFNYFNYIMCLSKCILFDFLISLVCKLVVEKKDFLYDQV